MSSFDYELKDQLRRAGAPVLSDWERRYRDDFNLNAAGAPVIDEPDQDIDATIEAMEARLRRAKNRLIGWSMAYGCAIGILATLAVQHIFGAA